MLRLLHVRFLVVLAALCVGSAAWGASLVQRHGADTGRLRQVQVQATLTAMLDMETGLRGYEITRRDEFLAPYRQGRVAYERAMRALGSRLHGAAGRDLAAVDAAGQVWQAQARGAIATVRARGFAAIPIAAVRARKAQFDHFRSAHATLAAAVEADRRHDASSAALKTAALALGLAFLVGLLGLRLVLRRDAEDRAHRRADAEYRASQNEFAETLQVAEDEHEAHDLLRRHLERTLPDARAVILNRNNSHDRLEAATIVADPVVAERLDGARPASCLAVRLGRQHVREAEEQPLMTCEICGGVTGAVACRPLLVGSEVIGSVLVTHPGALGEQEGARLADSVRQAAPVLANLRTLALAETRAATDALTGLPNRRSIDDTLKRMVAQASRHVEPMSALMLDLDHFKRINDTHGHERGDEALAAVGSLLGDSVRSSDFAGRFGGEEFIVLAPATDAQGARTLAENLRTAIEQLHVDELPAGVTASIGVATYPDGAADGAALLRAADRALYTAKQQGRNRVEEAASPSLSDSAAPVEDQ